MSFPVWKRLLMVALLLGATTAPWAQVAVAQEEGSRKAKSKVSPVYPDLARRMKIYGMVKVQLVVAPNGTVKDAKLVGGHPVLANAVLEAVRKWRYESGPQETTESLQFRFDPSD